MLNIFNDNDSSIPLIVCAYVCSSYKKVAKKKLPCLRENSRKSEIHYGYRLTVTNLFVLLERIPQVIHKLKSHFIIGSVAGKVKRALL